MSRPLRFAVPVVAAGLLAGARPLAGASRGSPVQRPLRPGAGRPGASEGRDGQIATLVARTRAAWPCTAGGGDGYAMPATAKPVVFPQDGLGLVETLLEAIEGAGAIAPAAEGRITRTSP